MNIHLGSIAQKIPGARCPKCGRSAEGGTSFGDERPAPQPKAGDFAVCLYCGEIHAYDERLYLRPLTRPERRRIARDPRLKELLTVAADASQALRRKWQ